MCYNHGHMEHCTHKVRKEEHAQAEMYESTDVAGMYSSWTRMQNDGMNMHNAYYWPQTCRWSREQFIWPSYGGSDSQQQLFHEDFWPKGLLCPCYCRVCQPKASMKSFSTCCRVCSGTAVLLGWHARLPQTTQTHIEHTAENTLINKAQDAREPPVLSGNVVLALLWP